MKKIKETEKGFYGCYWRKEGAECAMIAMLGDDCEDHMAKSAVKWLQKHFGLSVLTLSPAHKDYSHINLPVERIGAAIDYLKAHEIEKIAITGASTTGMFALLAASYYPELTLTIAMTPADFVMEGFRQGKRDGYTEWQGDGESSASWEGKPLPYLPYAYRHPEYGQKLKDESKAGGDMIAYRNMFVESEKRHPIQERQRVVQHGKDAGGAQCGHGRFARIGAAKRPRGGRLFCKERGTVRRSDDALYGIQRR